MGMIRKGTIGFQKSKTPETALIDSHEKLLKFAELNGIETCPFDVEEAAKKLGITVVHDPMLNDDISGVLKKEDDGHWAIYVNQRHHPRRQRYTIAHELGHFCLHKHQETIFEDQIFFRGLDRTKTETQANRFASNLLMPEEKFQQFLNEGITDVETLAEKFGVSTLALRIRAKDLGYSESET